MGERKRTLLQQLKSRKIWLEKFVGRVVDEDQRSYLALFAQQDFLLVFDQETGPAKLVRITPRHGSLICDTNVHSITDAPRQTSRRSRPRPRSTAKAPAERKVCTNPGPGWIKQADGSFLFGLEDLTDTFLRQVNQDVWQAWANGHPLLSTPSDLQDCAERAEAWLAQRHQKESTKMTEAQRQLDQMIESEYPDAAVNKQYQQVLESQLWVARFDKMLKSIERPIHTLQHKHVTTSLRREQAG